MFKQKHTSGIYKSFELAPAKLFKHKRVDKFVNVAFHHTKKLLNTNTVFGTDNIYFSEFSNYFMCKDKVISF